MKLREGATVVTDSGREVGKLRRLVIDRADRDVAYLVVGEGLMHATDTLVPMEAVARTSDPDRIVLEPGRDPQHFEPMTSERYGNMYRVAASGLIPHPVPAVPAPPAEAASPADRPMPDGSAIIEAGARVVAGDGKRFGEVEEVLVDGDGIIEDLVVETGMLWFKHRYVIPAGWIADVRRDAIHLTVPKAKAATRDTEVEIGQLPMV
jgi:sporulation protein YlmC with PRC-barrel domain